MSAIPTRAGERYLCFIVEREDRGWGGPYYVEEWPCATIHIVNGGDHA